MTHLDPKGDGRYIISNCKDQTIKLWDLRHMMDLSGYDHRQAHNYSFRWYVPYNHYPSTVHICLSTSGLLHTSSQ